MSGWNDGALNTLDDTDLEVSPSSQLAVTSWGEGNIMLCYQTTDGSIRILNGWGTENRWQFGTRLPPTDLGSPLSISNFEHYGHRAIRLYCRSGRYFQEACWDSVFDETREESEYFIGGYRQPVPAAASISAIAWKSDSLEMRIYLGGRNFLLEDKYSGVWLQFHRNPPSEERGGQIAAVRRSPGFVCVFSAERNGIVELVHDNAFWTNKLIYSRSKCCGKKCPFHTQESNAEQPIIRISSPRTPTPETPSDSVAAPRVSDPEAEIFQPTTINAPTIPPSPTEDNPTQFAPTQASANASINNNDGHPEAYAAGSEQLPPMNKHRASSSGCCFQ